jgi:ribonuclease HI
MRYKIYTDAATRLLEGYSRIAFIVLQGNNYITTHSELVQEKSTANAESIAIGKALKYVVENIKIDKDKDEIIVITDSLYAVKLSRKYFKKLKNVNSKTKVVEPINAYWLKDIYNSIDNIDCNISFIKIQAHQSGKTPHHYIDRLVKIGLNLK